VAKKYKISGVEIEQLVRWIARRGKSVEAVKVEICRDPDDNYVIGLAMAVVKKRKVLLVTGDKDILTLKGRIAGVVMVTPGEFLDG
jgi:predicted nucleic acid-binding protein